jgi:predicted nucleic acid-binding protein
MSGRFFLDTNIFVYTFDSSAPAKARRARQLIQEALETQRGIISYQVVQEFFSVALRRFAQPLSLAEAEQYMGAVFRPLLTIHSSTALYLEALRLSTMHRLAWYDSLIVAAASEGGCDVLYSEDLQHGRTIEGVRITQPF